MTELEQQEMKILEEVLKYVPSVYFRSLVTFRFKNTDMQVGFSFPTPIPILSII